MSVSLCVEITGELKRARRKQRGQVYVFMIISTRGGGSSSSAYPPSYRPVPDRTYKDTQMRVMVQGGTDVRNKTKKASEFTLKFVGSKLLANKLCGGRFVRRPLQKTVYEQSVNAVGEVGEVGVFRGPRCRDSGRSVNKFVERVLLK